MLGWVAERVAPDGVAVLGLAAQPGWQLFSSIRDVLKWHVAHLPAANHAAAARDLVRFLDDALAEESEPHAAWIRAIRLGFDEVDDDWIAREFLAAPIEAFWFHKLVAAAEATGLRWVTEARWHTTAIENFPPSIAEVLAEAEDDVEREQSMDLLRAKAWRQVVLAPYGSARQPEVLVPRESWIQPDFDVREHTDGQSLWVGRSGYALVPDELIGSLLVAGAPGGPVSEIVDASGRGWDEVQLALTRCWRAGVLDVRLTAPPAAEDPAIRLALSALARSGAPLSDRDGRAVDVSPEARAVLGDGIDPAGHLAVLDAPRRAEVLAELRAFGLPTAPDRVL